jgi:nucleotide-binding universal stress UspA family protein
VGNVVLSIVAGAWMLEALALGYIMGRRGYEAYSWTLVGTVLGPIAVVIALTFVFRPPSREPRLLRGGRRGTGSIDVLVGIDGSPAAAAAVHRAGSRFGSSAGRVTLARVVPLDATRETERLAETQLAAACAAHPELEPSTVVLRGEPVAALRDYVNRLGYEILVVGTRGEGKSRAMLGSVAMALARGAGIPVLLVDDVTAGTGTTTPTRPAR